MHVGKPSDFHETRQAFGLTYLHRITVAAQRRILTGLPLIAPIETRALDPRQVKLVSTSNLPSSTSSNQGQTGAQFSPNFAG